MTDMLWDSEPSTSVRLASSAKRAKGGRTRDPLGVGRSWLLRWAGRAAKLSEGIDGRIQRPSMTSWLALECHLFASRSHMKVERLRP